MIRKEGWGNPMTFRGIWIPERKNYQTGAALALQAEKRRTSLVTEV